MVGINLAVLQMATLNIESLCGPAVPLLATYSREMKTYVYTKTGTCMFIAAILIIIKKWKPPN